MATIPEKEPFIQSLDKSWYEGCVEKLDMLRLDIIHPVVSGNKWYKLKNNIKHVIDTRYKSVLTFGGAYSNHLIATAATANKYGLKSIGIVKGVYAQDKLTPTLQDCMDNGMQLVFVSNEEYKRKDEADYQEYLEKQFNNPYIIPEGGANEWGREGSMEIAQYIPDIYTHVCVAVGTGTTLMGVRNALPAYQKVLGYVPMKGGSYLNENIDKYIEPIKQSNYTLFDDWHCGGFGKSNNELIAFMNSFYSVNDIPLDMVYTAKMMLGLQEQFTAGYFQKETKILCIHTGGLQGNTTIKDKLLF